MQMCWQPNMHHPLIIFIKCKLNAKALEKNHSNSEHQANGTHFHCHCYLKLSCNTNIAAVSWKQVGQYSSKNNLKNSQKDNRELNQLKQQFEAANCSCGNFATRITDKKLEVASFEPKQQSKAHQSEASSNQDN